MTELIRAIKEVSYIPVRRFPPFQNAGLFLPEYSGSSSSSSTDISSASGNQTEIACSILDILDITNFSSFSGIIDNLSVNTLMVAAKCLLPGVENLTEKEKENIFHEDTQGTIAILLYEFASGEGEQERIFDNQDAITKDIMKLDFIQYAIDDFYENNLGRTDLQSTKYPYQFSPNFSLYAVLNSSLQHGKAGYEILSNGDWLSFFLGGTTVHVKPEEDNLIVSVDDSKSRNSWYYHLGVGIAQSTSRDSNGNKPLTTTRQVYIGSQRIDWDKLRTWNPTKSSSTAKFSTAR